MLGGCTYICVNDLRIAKENRKVHHCIEFSRKHTIAEPAGVKFTEHDKSITTGLFYMYAYIPILK